MQTATVTTARFHRINMRPTVVGTIRPRISIGATTLSSVFSDSYSIRTAAGAPMSSSSSSSSSRWRLIYHDRCPRNLLGESRTLNAFSTHSFSSCSDGSETTGSLQHETPESDTLQQTDPQQDDAVKLDDSHRSNKNDDTSQDGKRQGLSLLSFMYGKRPAVTDDGKQTTNTPAGSNVIKPRARNPIYNSKLHAFEKLNGFIPKANVQTTKATATVRMDDCPPVPLQPSNDESNISYGNKMRNQSAFKKEALKERLSNVGKKLLLFTKPSPMNEMNVLGDHLKAQGERRVPESTWVHVEGISPVSSLDAILTGVQYALDIEERRGIVNLDARWNLDEPIPFLSFPSGSDPHCLDETKLNPLLSSTEPTFDESIIEQPHRWVRKAKLIVSPFARPTGWYLKFENRSIVYALLRHAQDHLIRSSFRPVQVKEYKRRGNEPSMDQIDHNTLDPISYGNFILNSDISDATLLVENCPYNVTEASFLNFFSRYDLKASVDMPIQQWSGMTDDGKPCPPTSYLVHFADASWARAALREKQGTYMLKFGQVVIDYKNPKPLHLLQYPRQIL